MTDRILRIKETASTNDLLKDYRQQHNPEEGFVIFTPNQTAGKGQRGNSWESESGKNITFSILFYPDFLPLNKHFLLSETVALGVRDALSEYLPDIKIKWSNDIYFQDRKLAGILIENEITGDKITSSIAGIGVNVNQKIFSEKAPNPISLCQALKKEIEIPSLLNNLVASIRTRYQQLSKGFADAISTDYHNNLYRRTGFFPYKSGDETFFAKTDFVAPDGKLHLTTAEGERREFYFKEVGFI
jgi:BirA family biotin operon repressor/biotin-[acetyl-CoA-carboxylase] ligase